tara:strand:- start:28869 stop:29183 length:315 start_codon:yes stop_codon:yes gene_type:complete
MCLALFAVTLIGFQPEELANDPVQDELTMSIDQVSADSYTLSTVESPSMVILETSYSHVNAPPDIGRPQAITTNLSQSEKAFYGKSLGTPDPLPDIKLEFEYTT